MFAGGSTLIVLLSHNSPSVQAWIEMSVSRFPILGHNKKAILVNFLRGAIS
jgi:hypothetical protein